MEELKPCSACGSEADYIGETGFVWCTNVHCFLHREYEFTADWWNNRPIEEALRTELEQVKSMLLAHDSEARIYLILSARISRKDEEITALERMLKVAHVLHIEENHREYQAARARLAEVRSAVN